MNINQITNYTTVNNLPVTIEHIAPNQVAYGYVRCNHYIKKYLSWNQDGKCLQNPNFDIQKADEIKS